MSWECVYTQATLAGEVLSDGNEMNDLVEIVLRDWDEDTKRGELRMR